MATAMANGSDGSGAKHVLVTGGTGFIGRALCPALVAKGWEVTVLSRRPATVSARCGANVGALAALDDWPADFRFDAVINLAGEPIVDRPWTAARKAVLRDSRVGLTRRLVTAMARATRPPAVLLGGSAIGYYGDRGDDMLDENAPPASDFAAQLCRDWEQASRAAEARGVRVCLLRTGLVLDPAGGLLAKMLPAFRLGLGARLGDGRQWMSWISREDFVAATLFLLESAGARGAYNLVAPAPVTNAEFTRALAASLGRPAWFSAPSPLLRLALGERAPMLLGGQRLLPSRLLAQGFRFRHERLAQALSAGR